MRAIVKAAPGVGMQVVDRPVPAIGARDILIKVHHAGVCGTDLHIWEWDAWAAGRLRPPLIIGHEFAGEVADLGPDARADGIFAVGDLVTAEGHVICGHCLPCRTGNGHLCVRTSIIGVDRDGAFAEYIAMPASNVMHLDGIPTEIGAIMDPIGNAVHTALEGGAATAGTALVIGCGPIGCFAVGVLRAAGASLVLASDFNPTRRDLAQAMGAHHVFDPAATRCRRPRPRTHRRHRRRPGLRDERPSLRPRPGVRRRPPRRPRQPPRHAEPDHRSRLRPRHHLQGPDTVRRHRPEDVFHLDRDDRLLTSGQLDPRPVVTHRFPLERIADAIAVIKDGSAGKVILEIAP